MIIARVFHGITRHLKARAPEWALSWVLLNWGVILAWSPGLFDRPAYAVLVRVADQHTWSIACLAIGSARILALGINGTFADTWWSRFSPHVRAVMAFLACFWWVTISLSAFGAPQLTTWLAVYPVLMLLEAHNCIRAASDASISDGAYRHGSS